MQNATKVTIKSNKAKITLPVINFQQRQIFNKANLLTVSSIGQWISKQVANCIFQI